MKKTLVIIVIVALCLIATRVSTSFAAPTHGVISIAFDDGNQSQYDNAFPLLQSKGIVGTFYVVTDDLRDFSHDNSTMSIAELRNLQGNGSEIGSHSKTHRDFLGLTDELINYECSISKQVLEDNGLIVNNFAYPYGDTNDHIDSIVSQYYRSGRTAYTQPYIMHSIQFKLTGSPGENGNSTVLELLKTKVDHVYSTDGWTVIFFHNIIPNVNNASYTISTQDFSSFLDYVKFKGVQTLTVNQALNLPTSTLTMATNYGTVSPVSGQYITGTEITLSANAPAAGPGERYTWLGWTGSGAGSYNGLKNPVSFWIFGPVSQTASWKHEYYLNVTSPHGNPGGQGWYDAGSTAYATLATGTVSGGVGIRYVFAAWSGNASGTDLASDAITMDTAKTAIANWKTQYYLEVNNGGHGTASGEGWYDSGVSATFSISPTIVYEGVGTRYVFTQWSGNSTSTNPNDRVFMNGPKTITANWKTQYLVTFGQTGSGAAAQVTYTADTDLMVAVPFSTWVKAGSTLTFSYDAIVDDDGQPTRYVLVGVDHASPLLVNGPVTIIATYKTQHYITVTSAHGSPTPSAWVDAGSDFTASVTSPTETVPNDYEWVCTGFSVDGGTYQSGTAYTFTDVQAPHSIDFAWKQQFWIQVDSSRGSPTTSQWIDKGGELTVSVASPADDDGAGTRYRCTGWKIDGESIQVGSSFTFTNVQATHKIEFEWTTQYRLVVSSAHGSPNPTGTNWYDSGAQISVSVASPADDDGAGTRYRCTGWDGAGSVPSGGTSNSVTFTINTPSTLTWKWKQQFQVFYQQVGVLDGFTTHVVVNSVQHTLPYSDWFDQGLSVEFTYEDQVPRSIGTRYVLTSTSETAPLLVGASVNVTGYYNMQYTIGISLIFIPIVLGCLAIVIRRAKMKNHN